MIIVTSLGYTKRLDITNYDFTTRGNKGNLIQKLKEGDSIASILPVNEKDSEITIITLFNIIKVAIDQIVILGTTAQGSKGISLNEPNKVLKIIKE